jgi:hypothetical protein
MMNRGFAFLAILIFISGVPGLFAQAELPEPVFYGIAGPPAVEKAAPPEPALPDLYDLAYLWSADPGASAAALPALPPVEPRGFVSLLTLAAAASADVPTVIPANIRNNQYFLESLRLTKLAQESYDYGDYDSSTQYAAEALKYAQLSDEYVALQLKIKATNDAIAAAKTRLDWADSVGAPARYPVEFTQAQGAYEEAVTERAAEAWDPAIAAANRVLVALADVQEAPKTPPLPAQYTVRPWAISRDCLWNIAGRAWAYGDPTKWRLIYNANRTKLPEPDNPDLIHPGMVLDIPSAQGELRQGLWDPSVTYDPLP